MASIHDHDNALAPLKQLPHWSRLETRALDTSLDSRRLSMAHYEPLKPIEPGQHQTIGHYPSSNLQEDSRPPPRQQQLPGVHELLSPSIRTGAKSPTTGVWPPGSNSNPPSWRDRLLSTGGTSYDAPYASPTALHPIHSASHRFQVGTSLADYPRRNSSQLPLHNTLQRPPSLPVLPFRQPELGSPRSHTSREYSGRGVELSSPYQPMSTTSVRDTFAEQMLDQRSSSMLLGKPSAAGGALNLQIVGQRDIPGEGLCFVFKDGSTCPTVIDGEPVNPLWGTTKAGKARKRLAQACLNCREKKIKCEPGEASCLQCEKAKRECLRPSVQSQAELGVGATSSASNPPSEGEWRSPHSPRSTSLSEIPEPKRRRSAHVAQQESAFSGSVTSANASSKDLKRRRSDDFADLQPKPDMERLRKDSKRTFGDEDEHESGVTLSGKPDVMAQCEDPYQIEPEGTMLFLDLFFAQSAREVRLLFPQKSFTRWAKTCHSKCQRECMVLYAVLAAGSIFSKNEFSSFSRICVDRATQAATNLYGRFSMALIQTRLLLGFYSHMKGKNSLAVDYNGSALRAASVMRLNTEEGCGESLEEYARPCYSFSHEQLRECRRRTFWAAHLADRLNGGGSVILNTIHEDDIHIRLPCEENVYEDGFPSATPFFNSTCVDLSSACHPVAYTIMAIMTWTDVGLYIHRSAHESPSTYAATYEAFLGNTQQRFSNWNNRLPSHLKYSRNSLEQAIIHDYAGDLVSMHILHHFSQLRVSRMIRHELMTARLVARNICTAHSHALQLLALVRDLRAVTYGHNRRLTDYMSSFIAEAVVCAIDTVGAGGLREEFVATTQVLSTATDVVRELSQYCHNARTQSWAAQRRLAQMESIPPELDTRVGKGADARCWRIAEPIESALSPRQDVMYGISPATFCNALIQGRMR